MKMQRFTAAHLIGAALASGGSGIALFDSVMGHLLDEQAAHVELLELELEDARRRAERCADQLDHARDLVRDCERRE